MMSHTPSILAIHFCNYLELKAYRYFRLCLASVTFGGLHFFFFFVSKQTSELYAEGQEIGK